MKNHVENIINDFKLFINSGELKSSKLLSFAFPLEILPTNVSTDRLSELFSEVFLFRSPNDKLSIIGLNSAIDFNSDNSNSFSSFCTDYNYWGKNFVNNWSRINIKVPIIFCFAKFDPNNTSELWNEFNPVRIFIPEFVLKFQQQSTTIFFNFISTETIEVESLISRLTTFLNKLYQISFGQINSTEKKLSIKTKSDKDEYSDWKTISLKALSALKKGEVNKLVLSRSFSFEFRDKVNWDNILNKLRNRFPDCYLFFVKKNNSIFFGSSPEMFLKVSDNTAEVESVAGSAARGEKTESDYELEKFLKTSEKNHHEHIFVSDFITGILIKYSDNVRVIEEKQIRKLDNIQHLITRISANLNSQNNLFELIDSLFPTPAVCGVPKEKAIELIRNIESHDRGLYSGLVGVFDFDGSCELAVSIRSALVKNQQITAFAGAGLVKDSDPKEEFMETNLKLNTILSLFADEN